MNYSYRILVQFAKSSATFIPQVKEAVSEAVTYFNSRSAIARNPKRIKAYSYLDDDQTLLIELESSEALPTPSKGLRLLSTYLVQSTFLGDQFLAGKQLFKMALLTDKTDVEIQKIDGAELIAKVVSRAYALLKTGKTEEIIQFLKEEE
jgi:hypothetical protein